MVDEEEDEEDDKEDGEEVEPMDLVELIKLAGTSHLYGKFEKKKIIQNQPF